MDRLASFVAKSDIRLFYLFNRKLHCLLLDIFMKKITHLGSTAFSIILTIVLIFSGNPSLYKAGIHVAIVLIASQIIAQLAKRIINRPRPYVILENAIALNPPSCKYSFPSGHTCAAFAVAFTLSGLFPALTPVFLSLSTLVALSRIYLGFHYPSDVIFGFFIAYFCWMLYVKVIMPGVPF